MKFEKEVEKEVLGFWRKKRKRRTRRKRNQRR
jgi:hypothetical protein